MCCVQVQALKKTKPKELITEPKLAGAGALRYMSLPMFHHYLAEREEPEAELPKTLFSPRVGNGIKLSTNGLQPTPATYKQQAQESHGLLIRPSLIQMPFDPRSTCFAQSRKFNNTVTRRRRM